MKPCLSMPHGRLRPATAGDLDGLVRLLRDRQVRRYLCDDVVLPRSKVAEMLERSEGLDSQGLGLWAVENAHGDFAGIAGLAPVSGEAGAAPETAGGIEPVVAIDPIYWGQGLASDALTALIGHARDSLQLPRLVAAVDRPNERSHRLLERCGFAVAGKAPGPAHELVLYGLSLGEAGRSNDKLR